VVGAPGCGSGCGGRPCATSSRTRAWAVRKVQLATLIGYQIPENSC
jgi:hypothetical protein